MHKLRKASVLVAALGSVALLGGTASAQGMDGHGNSILQSSNCKSHDLNVDVLGQVGLLNGVLGNALNGEGNSGGQDTHLGSKMGCNSSAF
ncbi:hypothetical protein [Streptomyces sp. NPDC048581]|jgi:hypothetical protein|uniref:hypothetical protein n=1 Tax=unclassified Streptomyces TaxID=2593676 RepID=UPI0037114798